MTRLDSLPNVLRIERADGPMAYSGPDLVMFVTGRRMGIDSAKGKFDAAAVQETIKSIPRKCKAFMLGEEKLPLQITNASAAGTARKTMQRFREMLPSDIALFGYATGGDNWHIAPDHELFKLWDATTGGAKLKDPDSDTSEIEKLCKRTEQAIAIYKNHIPMLDTRRMHKGEGEDRFGEEDYLDALEPWAFTRLTESTLLKLCRALYSAGARRVMFRNHLHYGWSTREINAEPQPLPNVHYIKSRDGSMNIKKTISAWKKEHDWAVGVAISVFG